MYFVFCVSHAFASVHCCLVVTCWERADLLALVGDVNCIFVTFPCGILGQVWHLIVSFAIPCRLSYITYIKPLFCQYFYHKITYSLRLLHISNALQKTLIMQAKICTLLRLLL